MKTRVLFAFFILTYLITGCSRTAEHYVSRREKTPDMQDAKIREMKNETTEDAVTETEEEVTEEVTEPPMTETTEEDPETENENETAELEGFLNMRSGPGVEYDVILLLEEGDQITLLEEEYAEDDTLWYIVSYGDVRGYVEEEAFLSVLVTEEETEDTEEE